MAWRKLDQIVDIAISYLKNSKFYLDLKVTLWNQLKAKYWNIIIICILNQQDSQNSCD